MQWTEFCSHIRHIGAEEIAKIQEAFELGKHVHAAQKRHSGEPYFTHPIAVAHILASLGADTDTLIAALLHDAIEDTPLTYRQVEQQFGKQAADLIEGVTKIYPEEVAEIPTADDQIETLRKIFTLMETDVRIMIIKLADRLHNMQTVEYMEEERQRTYSEETRDVFVKIADRLCMQDMRDELEALCMQILEPELFSKLNTLRIRNEKNAGAIITRMNKTLSKDFEVLKTECLYEAKPWPKLQAQLTAEGKAVTGTSSYTAIFICDKKESAYQILGLLHEEWQRETLSFEDFMNSPMINGYQGIHTTIILQDGTRIRCKIRTPKMHEYARRGIMVYCFDNKAIGISQYLQQWAGRIAPFAEDTEEHSAEFQKSLESDILGESIVIHGPADQAILLPKNVTALDGAFYCFQDTALRVKSIKIDGHEVPFQSPLQNAQSLDIEIGSSKTVERSWLDWVQTGYATAKIRRHLSMTSENKKMAIGRQLLQEVMTERRHGFIEEYNEDKWKMKVIESGYSSMKQAYSAIANGYMRPSDLYGILFEHSSETQEDTAERVPCSVHFSVNIENPEAIANIMRLYKRFGITMRNVRFRPFSLLHGQVQLRCALTPKDQEKFAGLIRRAGGQDVRLGKGSSRLRIMSYLLIMTMWGLDPVLGKMILNADVSPLSFALVRACTVLFFAYGVFAYKTRFKFVSRIPIVHPSLWIAGFGFAMVNLFTYYALEHSSPLFYNTILRGNVLMIAIPILVTARHFGKLALFLVPALAGFYLLTNSVYFPHGFMFSFYVLFFFYIYTRATARFQQVAKVSARYPQFFFFTSVIAATIIGILSAIVQPVLPSFPMVLLICAFTVVFIGVPYILFYSLMQDTGYPSVSPWISFAVAVTFIAQVALLDLKEPFIMIAAAILLVCAGVYASRSINTHIQT